MGLRELLWIIEEKRQTTSTADRMRKWNSFDSLQVEGDNLMKWKMQWHLRLDALHPEDRPSDANLGIRFYAALRKSPRMQPYLEMITRENLIKNKEPYTYQDWLNLLERYFEEKLHNKNEWKVLSAKPGDGSVLYGQRKGRDGKSKGKGTGTSENEDNSDESETDARKGKSEGKGDPLAKYNQNMICKN